MAIRNLKPYWSKFNSLITICTPHLGAGATSDILFNLGFSLLLKFSAEAILKELAMGEFADIQKTALFNLSISDSLSQFRKICLVSSPQDNFSPSESSLILATEAFCKASHKNKHHAAQLKMIQNITGLMNCEMLSRISINYTFSTSTMDTFIGRAAHIGSLNNPLVAEVLASRFQWLINN